MGSLWIRHLWMGVALGVALGGPVAAQSPQPAGPVDLKFVIDAARQNAPKRHAAKAGLSGAELDHDAAWFGYFPFLSADLGVQRWSGPQSVSLGDFGGLGLDIPPTQIRDATTWSASVSLVQPLTGLWTADLRRRSAALNVALGRQELDSANRDVGYKAVEAFIRVLQAKAAVLINDETVRLSQVHLARAQAFFDEKALLKTSLLRAKLAVTDARHSRLAAIRNQRLAAIQLEILLGRSAVGQLEVRPIILSDQGPTLPPVATLQREARQVRPEVVRLRTQIQLAENGAEMAWSSLVPTVNLLLSATFQGGSDLQGGDDWFVGLSASWNFAWGAEIMRARASGYRVKQIQASQEDVAHGVTLEVTAAHAEARGLLETLDLAKAGVEQANEYYKLTQAQFDEKRATSLDVADAQTQLATAQKRFQATRYEFLIAWLRVHRAAGTPLETALAEGNIPL